jgi:hypothetical protein
MAVQQKPGSHHDDAAFTEGDTMSETSTELVVPGLGTLVDLTSVESCAIALNDIRDYERQYRYIKQELTEALVKASEVEGTKTLHFPGGKATIKTGEEWVYDPEEIELGLRAAGMPEHRIRQIVKETVQYKVDAVQAKQAQSANPEYDRVIGDNKTLEQKQPSVSISRLTTSS